MSFELTKEGQLKAYWKGFLILREIFQHEAVSREKFANERHQLNIVFSDLIDLLEISHTILSTSNKLELKQSEALIGEVFRLAEGIRHCTEILRVRSAKSFDELRNFQEILEEKAYQKRRTE